MAVLKNSPEKTVAVVGHLSSTAFSIKKETETIKPAKISNLIVKRKQTCEPYFFKTKKINKHKNESISLMLSSGWLGVWVGPLTREKNNYVYFSNFSATCMYHI